MKKTLILVDPLWYENETLYKNQGIPIIEMMHETALPPGRYVVTTLRGAKSGDAFYVDPTAGERSITNPKMKPTLDFSIIDYVTFIKAQEPNRIKTPEDFIAYPSGEQKQPPEQQLAGMAQEAAGEFTPGKKRDEERGSEPIPNPDESEDPNQNEQGDNYD